MTFAVQTSLSQTYQYGEYSSRSSRTDADFNKELMGKATSLSNSSSNGKNIGIMTIGNFAMSSTYEHGLKCQSIIDALESWSDMRILQQRNAFQSA